MIALAEQRPWLMVPIAAALPVALVIIAVLAAYFVRLGRDDVPRERRIVRRLSVATAITAVAGLFFGLAWFDPHQDRRGFALAWIAVAVAVASCLLLAFLDVLVTARRGLLDFRQLRKETLGGDRGRSDG